MRRFLTILFTTIGVLSVLTILGAAGAGWWVWARIDERRELPERFVIVADWREEIPERSASGGLVPSVNLRPELTVSEVVLTLDRARNDPRVEGFVALLDDTDHGLAVAQELRAAVERFKADGERFAVAYADTFGELTSGLEGYYIASAFDRIGLQPVGLVGLIGLSVESPFLASLLQNVGIDVQVEARREYKTAADNLYRDGLTPANREMISAIVDGTFTQIRDGVASSRGIDPGRASELLTQGPYTAGRALELGLVDEIAHQHRFFQSLPIEGEFEDVTLDRYAARLEQEENASAEIALIRASGGIMRGDSELAPGIQGEALASLIEDAIEDDEIDAVVLRVDSPGGSAVASETIAFQIRRAIEAGKPVVVSMSNVAGSGGYWIAMHANSIVAHRATLTGSIGVIAIKPVLADLWEELEVNWDAVSRGPYARMWSFNEPFSDRARERVVSLVDELYADFKQGVAEGRDMPLDRVEELARGRVWLGAQAAEMGLVDETGGLMVALDEARRLLDLDVEAPLDIRLLPRRKGPLDQLERLASLSAALDEFAMLWTELRANGLLMMAPSIQVR